MDGVMAMMKRVLLGIIIITGVSVMLIMFKVSLDTLGNRLPYKEVISIERNETKANDKRWSAIAAEYHSYVNTEQIHCSLIYDIGYVTESCCDICDEEKFRPKEPCLIYSFGIAGDRLFEEAISEQYGCHVHSFDPSLYMDNDNLSSLVHLHKFGLADRNYVNRQGLSLKTLAQIRNDLGHSQIKLPFLKMDIENQELTAIPEMIRSGAVDDVTQIVLGIHMRRSPEYEPEPDIEKYEMGLNVLKQLYNKGFRMFRTKKVEWSRYVSRSGYTRYGCHELGWIRV